MAQGFEIAVECQATLFKGLPEPGKEEAAIQAGQDAHGQEESGPTCDPLLGIRGQSPAGHDAMEMGMMQQVLAPRRVANVLLRPCPLIRDHGRRAKLLISINNVLSIYGSLSAGSRHRLS